MYFVNFAGLLNEVSRNDVESVLNILNSFETNPVFLVISREGSELHNEDVEENGAVREF